MPPSGWTGGRCLSCHRSHLLDGNRGKGGDRSDLLLFELRRGERLRTAARRARMNIARAREAERALIENGQLDPDRTAPRRSQAAIREERQAADLAVLREAGELTIVQFAQRRGLPKRTAKKRLDDLRKVGKAAGAKVEGSKAWVWSVTG